ncbi:MAG: peptidoglycan DD-metalloendopeptidase family protein [Desulfuromonadales bacterium]
MNYDFSPPNRAKRQKKNTIKPRHWVLVGLLAVVATIFLVDNRSPVPDTEAHVGPPELKIPPQPPLPEQEIRTGRVNAGDTITSLLGSYFSPREIHDLSRQSREVFPLSRICAGRSYQLCTEEDSFKSFTYDIDSEEQLIISKSEDEFLIKREPIPYTIETDLIRGTISTSMFEAMDDAGGAPEVAIALADIFAWDIDFLRDVRKGDTFQALIEKRFRDGELAGFGKILAAEFTNGGRTFQAIRFTDGEQSASYYDPEGNNLRKTFLRAPLSYSRISSGFTKRRFHPITKTWKSHPAIDYAAPTGTPIMTVGDGVISRIGRTKYNGNYIKIRHNSSYETLYLHMQRFAKGMKKGKRITQGQTIGYVGSTGLATGPHLCFRMYKNQNPVNPHKIKAPSADPVSEELMPRFKEVSSPLLARLKGREPQGDRTQVASAEAR